MATAVVINEHAGVIQDDDGCDEYWAKWLPPCRVIDVHESSLVAGQPTLDLVGACAHAGDVLASGVVALAAAVAVDECGAADDVDVRHVAVVCADDS